MSNATIHIETEKQLIPVLRFKEFEGSWEKDILKTRIDSIDSGWSPQCEGYPALNEEWGVLKTTAVVWEGFNQNANKKLPDTLEPRPNLQVVEEDILITRAGPTSRVGVTVFLNEVRSKLMLSDKLIRLKVNDSTSSLFLSISLGNRDAQKQLVSKSSGLAESQTNISQKILLNTKLLFPQFPEQQKIASFLSAVDEKIQQLSKKETLLKEYKKGVMQQLFSGQLRFKDENGKDYPDWDWVSGNELFDNISDKKHNSDLPILAITQDQGAIPRELINYQMTVTEASVASYKVVQKGDFIISLRTFQGGIEFSDYHGICSPAYNILRPNSENVDRAFYRFYLKTSFYIRQLQKNLEGIRDGKMISYKYFSEIKVPFPSKLEQQKIARYLSGIDTKIESVNNQITQTQTFKKGLLQQLFV
jgi:type I restriction enzyme S subunit